ncbi:MAG: hypothetical protein IJY05_03425 [Clostridia bacterium]|nr:hypothetical protein [Clostridia bacterium]
MSDNKSVEPWWKSREEWLRELPWRAVWMITIFLISYLFLDIRIYFSNVGNTKIFFGNVYLCFISIFLGSLFSGMVRIKNKYLEALLTATVSTFMNIITTVYTVYFSVYKIVLAIFMIATAIALNVFFVKKDNLIQKINGTPDEKKRRKFSKIFILVYFGLLSCFFIFGLLSCIESYQETGFRWTNIYG